MIGAVALGVLMLCVSASVDVARWHAARTVARQALDAALLGGARTLQVTRGDIGRAGVVAARYLDANLGGVQGLSNQIRFVAGADRNQLAARGSVTLTTFLLPLIGLPIVTVLSAEEVASVNAKAAIGEGTQTEIVLALDVSEHMGQALPEVAAAARDLIEIIAASDPRGERHRFAVVPFADSVTLPDEIVERVRGPLRAGDCATPGCRALRRVPPGCAGPECRGTVRLAGPCMGERPGRDAVSDAPPDVAPLMPLYPNRLGTCQPKATVLPLSSSLASVKQVTAALEPGGRAAGHLGLAWAWYALAPGWSRVWPGMAGSDYDLLQQRLPSGAAMLRKIVILVTPGQFDRQYCDGVADDAVDGCIAPNGSSHVQARALCRAMIAKGIEIFTVMYPAGGDGEAGTTLRGDCASSRETAYTARDGRDLAQAVRDIGLKIATTRLMN